MTNTSISKSFAVLSFVVLSALLSVGVFATTVHAQEDLGYADFSGDNLGYGDFTGDNLGYADTYGSNLGYGDVSGDNLGYGDTYGSNLGYGDTYGDNLGYGDNYGDNLGYGDTYGTDVTGTDVTGTDVTGTDVTYDNGIGYSYTPTFSAPTYYPATTFPAQPISFIAPSYTPVIPPAPVPHPVPAPAPIITQPNVTTITNTNNNVNNNVNNNNINVNTNSNNVTVATVAPIEAAPVQHVIQYVQPAPVYYQQPTCTISITNYNGNNYGPYGYNQLATLTWSSQNATSGYINPNIGSVSGWGSMQVYPTNGQVYSMTVYGQGGSATCTSQPYYIPVAPAPVVPQTPYVSLSQIPYTGFDFGTTGNAIYWLSLMVFAGAAAYLVLYFNGGALAVLGANRRKSSQIAMPKITVRHAPAITAKIVEAPVVSPIQLATPSRKNTSDTMHVTHSKEGSMPRIHISRE